MSNTWTVVVELTHCPWVIWKPEIIYSLISRVIILSIPYEIVPGWTPQRHVRIEYALVTCKYTSYCNKFPFWIEMKTSLITWLMGPTWGIPGADRNHVDPMWASHRNLAIWDVMTKLRFRSLLCNHCHAILTEINLKLLYSYLLDDAIYFVVLNLGPCRLW